MQSEIGGVPFIGEGGHYPRWARGSGRWVFQRTLIVVGKMLGDIARLHAMEVSVANQVLVWAPPIRLPILGARPSAMHRERQRALGELGRFSLVCYGDKCAAPKPGTSMVGLTPALVIRESGVQPDKWLLVCPSCGASVGPDIANMLPEVLIRRWVFLGQSRLENPGAGVGIQASAPIADLQRWIDRSQPSHLELAYLGQQMWPNIEAMLVAMTDSLRLAK